jgi:ubiquinone/menaquinone biosynthesis C-methylase UbiE
MLRHLEPEVMDSWEEATAYDAMDFSEVNMAFAQQTITLGPPQQAVVLDAGTGTARIPILICQMRQQWQIVAIDLAQNMLQIAATHVQAHNLQQQIKLEFVDAKCLPYKDQQFDMVISNSLVHHLPHPLVFFKELKRVLKPHGAILIRDLFRPANEESLNLLVASIGEDFDQDQKKLVRDSLCAALTVEEVSNLVTQVGLEGVHIYQSSDRHWTIERAWTHPE